MRTKSAKISSRVLILTQVFMFMAILPVPPLFSSPVRLAQVDKKALEKRVSDLLKEQDVVIRANVADILMLGDLYLEESNPQEAMRLYQEALTHDPWYLDYQLLMGHLLYQSGDSSQAIEKATVVYQYAEDTELIQGAKKFLLDLGVDLTPEKTVRSPELSREIEIVLVPVGQPSQELLGDLRDQLETVMGISYTIEQVGMDLGGFDRSYTSLFIDEIIHRISRIVPEPAFRYFMADLKLDDRRLRTADGVMKLIERMSSSSSWMTPEMAVELYTTLDSLSGGGQFYVDRLLGNLSEFYPSGKKSGIKGYLGVTERDLYVKDSNFVCTAAIRGYGITSYYRLLSDLNGEHPNRPRLVQRTLKRAVSSSFAMLGISDCTNPICIRSFPGNLVELNIENNQLCSWCKNQLRTYLDKSSSR